MAIKVTCNSCGTTLRTKDSAAGKRAKCPSCGEVLQIPDAPGGEEILDAEETSFDDLGDPDEWGAPVDDYDDDQKPCPMCGEMIKATAAKCRYCGEIFDPILKKRAKKSKKGGAADADEDMTTGDWIVAILCSGIGCIAGIVWMIQGKPKGVKMFLVSIGMQFVWAAVRVVIEVAANM